MKKLIMYSLSALFTFHFSLFTPQYCGAQGTWTSRDTLPDSAMCQGIPGFSIGNFGYAGLGDTYYAGRTTTDLWQFDASTNKWAKKKAFPGKARVAPACFVIDDKAYIVCGSIANGFPCVNECWEYDATNNTWTQKANFPGGARVYAVGFAIDSLGYVGTGANELSDFYKDFYEYHPSTDTWTRIADFGGIARDGDCGFAVNGKGYVCGGQDSVLSIHKDMWEYDPLANTWTQKTNNPYPMVIANGFVICNNIYLGSGDSTAGLDGYNEFWKYNTVSDSWTQQTTIPGIKKVEGAAFAISDTGYYGFGCRNTGVDMNIFDKFYGGDSCKVNEGYQVITDNSKIKIYPNPFTTNCTIELTEDAKNAPTIFSLYDMEGRKMEISILPLSTDNYYVLKRCRLKGGIYILSVKDNQNVFYKKLVLLN